MPDQNHPLSDQELLEKVSRGDESAFQQLYQRYKSGIYNYILRLVHEKGVAEELFQDVFIVVWQGAPTFRSQSSVKTWIFRIAYFKSVSWLRKNRDTDELDENGSYAIQVSTPEEIFIENFESGRIIAALEKLSPNHRSVIELTFVHGFSYKEIAATMKCPIGTVKSRMSYALKNLVGILAQDDNK